MYRYFIGKQLWVAAFCVLFLISTSYSAAVKNDKLSIRAFNMESQDFSSKKDVIQRAKKADRGIECEIINRLNSFHGNLKTFIIEGFFYLHEFSLRKNALEKELLCIVKKFEVANLHRRMSLGQITLTHTFFETMIMTSQQMEKSFVTNDIHEKVLARLLELHLLALAMLDSFGVPDYRMKGYDEKVIALTINFNKLVDHPNWENKAPSKTILAIWNQLTQIRSLITHLGTCVQSERKSSAKTVLEG